MEKQPNHVQIALFSDTDTEPRVVQKPQINFQVLDIRAEEAPQKKLPEGEGVSLSLEQYYRHRKAMIQQLSATNRRSGYVSYTETPEGFNEAYQRYGATVYAVIDATRGAMDKTQQRMDALFMVDELIAVGFAAGAVRRASRLNAAELSKAYVGSDHAHARTRAYRYLDKKIAEHSS